MMRIASALEQVWIVTLCVTAAGMSCLSSWETIEQGAVERKVWTHEVQPAPEPEPENEPEDEPVEGE